MKEVQSNGLNNIITQAIEEMKVEQGSKFSLQNINLAELERRTGVSRSRLRRLKENNFSFTPRAHAAKKDTIITPYAPYINKLLNQGITNSVICFNRLQDLGFTGSLTTVKRYIQMHKDLVPAKRQLTVSQSSRGKRYITEPGEAYQMDWGFTKVVDYTGHVFQAACFAIICHHCGQRYVEFFPNAK